MGIVSLPLHEYSSSLPAAPDSGRTPGREKDFLRLGYAVEAFPSTQDASCLDDAEPEELPLHAYAPGWRHGDLPVVRSRRASLVRMLADPRWQKEDHARQ
ncbi:hypothetical protein CXU13_06200 [Akkermansia muciniphila]|nr:hypothetical protein CXU12_08635 [Akkermansia muciniphila]PNC59473.1 hypothetical protein CXU13_06200 [Akkermansia muciniphila]